MPFDPDDPRLTAYALGELDSADREAIEASLRDDPEGRAHVSGIEATARLLTDELRRESAATPGLDPPRRSAIEDGLIPTTVSISNAPAPPRRRFPVIPVALAATIIGGIGLGLLLPALQSSRRAASLAPVDYARVNEAQDTTPRGDTSSRDLHGNPSVTTFNGSAISGDAFGSTKPTPPARPSQRSGSKLDSIQASPEDTLATRNISPSDGLTGARPETLAKSKERDNVTNFASALPAAPTFGRMEAMAAGQPTPPVADYRYKGRMAGQAGDKGPGTGGPGMPGMGGMSGMVGMSGMGMPGMRGGVGGGMEGMYSGGRGDMAAGRVRARYSERGADASDTKSKGLLDVTNGTSATTFNKGKDQAPQSAAPLPPSPAKLGDYVTLNSQSNTAGPVPASAPTPSLPQIVQEGKKLAEPKPEQLALVDAARPALQEQEQQVRLQRESLLRQAREQGRDELADRKADFERAKLGREAYARFYDHPFVGVLPGNELSTFAIDVDTAAYANVRRFLSQGQLPPVDAVRIEELVNYFTYDDPAPKGDAPFSVNVEVARCPWDASHRLARVGLKGKTIDVDKRPASNLVFLIDVSGSMDPINRLPLLRAGMKLMVGQLGENDRVSIVTYANGTGVALPSTTADRKGEILAALDNLRAGGGTNGGAGIELAYQQAAANFIKGGTNRVILGTDGDFNVGLSKEALLARSEERAKGGIFLSVLGVGEGNIQEDFMEQLADKGNGNFSYIDSIDEARKVLVRQMTGTLDVIAKDVKIQVEFNPAKVASYRLIGYENRVMANEDFRDDKKDAGEIGAGHSVTALYEIVPAGTRAPAQVAAADRPLKYAQKPTAKPDAPAAGDKVEGTSPELLTVFLRFKKPDGDKATEISRGVTDDGRDFGAASNNLKFSAAVAGFGMLLRESPHKGNLTYPAVREIASGAVGDDKDGDRKGFLSLVDQARQVVGQ